MKSRDDGEKKILEKEKKEFLLVIVLFVGRLLSYKFMNNRTNLSI
jgi:hypothetical protein